MVARLGEQSDVVTNAWSNWTPCAARACRFGSCRNGRRRPDPKSPYAMSSAMMTTKLGRPVAAGGAEVAAVGDEEPPQPLAATIRQAPAARASRPRQGMAADYALKEDAAQRLFGSPPEDFYLATVTCVSRTGSI